MDRNNRIYLFILLTALVSAFTSVALYRFVAEPAVVMEDNAYPTELARNTSTHNFAGAHFMSSAPTDFINACKEATPGVVYISSRQKIDYDFFAGARYGESKGSGVLISPHGYIVTNNHVIEGGKDINVTLNDNREYKARIIGIDPSTDLALLKIEEEKLPFIQFGNSDSLHVGEWVLAMGNPF